MAPVYKVKLRSALERPRSRLNEYLRAIKKGKQMPKSQCSVVIFKPHENRLATLLTRYLNKAGTLSAKRCEKYKKSIQKRVQSKHKNNKKKKTSPDDGVKATKVQKGNTHVMQWTNDCMKQFLSPKMSKDVMLWRPRSPDTSQVQVRMPPGKPSTSTTSVSRKKRVPQVTSLPSFAYPTWKISNQSVMSTKSAPPSRRKKKRKLWHKQLARHSLTSFKSQIGRIPSDPRQKRIPRKKKSGGFYQLKFNDQLKKKARDFLCKFVDQYFNSRKNQCMVRDLQYTDEVVDTSLWFKRAQKLCEKIGVMEPVLEVEEENSNEDREPAKGSRTGHTPSPRSPNRKRSQSPKEPRWPEADLGCIKIEEKGTKIVSSKDKNDGDTSEKLEEPTIDGLAITLKTETFASQSESTLKTNKSDATKINVSARELLLDTQDQNPIHTSRSKTLKILDPTEETKAKSKVKKITPSEPNITSSQTKIATDASKIMPISKSEISRQPDSDPGKKHGTGVKTRKTNADVGNKTSSQRDRPVTEHFQTRKGSNAVGKLKSLHDRPAGDTASTMTTASTELCSVELENESNHAHSLSVDGVSYSMRLSNEEYGRFPCLPFTGDSEHGYEDLKKRLTKFWTTRNSKSELNDEECNENLVKRSDVPKEREKRRKSVSRG